MPASSKPHAIAFDLDGAILDSLHAMYEATVLALRDIVSPERAKAWRLEDARATEWKGFDEIARTAAGPELGPAVAKRCRERFVEVAVRAARPFDDVMPALEALTREKVPLAVASGRPAPMALELLTRFGLAKRFRVVLGTGDRMPAKPHPWVVVEAARALHVPPRCLAFVGDAQIDVVTAKAAGAISWIINRDRTRATEGADHVLASLEELPDLVRAKATDRE